uniref:Uncharacterized protein n=2 Tax=Oryza TaxID=4527 RepID=A0A0E0QG62_ORYRU
MRVVRACKGERVVPTLMAPAEPSGYLSGPSPMWTERVKGWSKSLGQYKRRRVGPEENEVEWSKWRSLASPLVEKSERNGSPSTPTNTYAFMAEDSIIAAT